MLAAAVLPSATAWLYFVALSRSPAAVQQTAYTAGKIVQFGFPLVWVFLVAPASRWSFNYHRARRLCHRTRAGRLCHPCQPNAGLVAGGLFGAAVFAAILIGYHAWLRPAGLLDAAFPPLAAKLAGFGIDSPAKFIMLGVFYCLIHSLLEEYYWRWFLFGGLERLVPPAAAVLLSSLAFAAHHVIILAIYFGWLSASTLVFALGVAVGGGVWAWLYRRSGSLLGPWLSHLLVDAAIFVIGYEMVFTGAAR